MIVTCLILLDRFDGALYISFDPISRSVTFHFYMLMEWSCFNVVTCHQFGVGSIQKKFGETVDMPTSLGEHPSA